MTAENQGKRIRNKLLLGALVLAMLLIPVALFRFLTHFDRALVRYARVCEGSQSAWYSQVREVKGEELANSLYLAIYTENSRIPAKAERTFAYNVIEDRVVPALRCQGMLYIVLHKWKNFCAGVCVPVAHGATRVVVPQLDYCPVDESTWLYWKADFER